MQKFTTLTAIAAPLPMANVDTDKIIPAQFCKVITRTGLGVHLFHALRYDETGAERAEFVLNKQPYRHAQILIALENFGCGSSREYAPWALLDFGIRCIIAPDFADIFHTNCFKNSILPVCLPRDVCLTLMQDAQTASNAQLTVDLERQVVVRPNGEELHFQTDPFRRHMLLEGLDDISLTLKHVASIDAYEAWQRTERAWLPPITVPPVEQPVASATPIGTSVSDGGTGLQ